MRATVRKFNAKLTRVAKKTPELAYIQPDRINISEMRKALKAGDRKEFNRVLAKMERYLRKGAELPYTTQQDVMTTRWEMREITIAYQTINQRRAAMRRKAGVSTEAGTMGTIKAMGLQPRKVNTEDIRPENWRRFVVGLERQVVSSEEAKKKGIYRANILKATENKFGPYSPLLPIFESMEADTLVDFYFTNPYVSIDFIYGPKDAEVIERVIIDEMERLGIL